MKKRAIMFQGVSSSAGKSLCAAALCRILKRKGIKVAPFKAQNMSLNSFVTKEGGEMGRSQALQAMACGIEPEADMNPILLKPMGNSESQIIVRGQVYGRMTYRDYTKIKKHFWNRICEAYNRLSGFADVMVLEGAGSPAEINLQRHDIVNMRMAHEAEAPVLLIADIDRGGAFAALAGTMSLIKPEDRKLVSGFILNRFRGDKNLLFPALLKMEKRCKRPFMGIIPMIEDLALPEEDSASLDLNYSKRRENGKYLDVVIPLLPGISNFTDFDPLASEKGVKVRLVRNANEFGEADLVIIPGSRRVDLAISWLEKSGLAQKIRQFAERATKTGRGHLLGICAGLQIMGLAISDPASVEGQKNMKGLGIISLQTELRQEKIVRRTSVITSPRICAGEFLIEGYEIHHGVSKASKDAVPVMVASDGEITGWGRAGENDCRIWGTYLHGLFENDQFRHAYLDRIYEEAGINNTEWEAYDINKEIDRLADVFADNADMDQIFRLLGL